MEETQEIKNTGEVAAGSNETFTLDPENAVRIFTGAAVPAGADTVVMQEKVKVENGELKIEDENFNKEIVYDPKVRK